MTRVFRLTLLTLITGSVLTLTGCSLLPPSAEVVAVRIEPFTAVTGQHTYKIFVDWRNTGKVPIRYVRAKIIAYDEGGKILDSAASLPIYKVSNDSPGIAPGESYHQPNEQMEGYPIMPTSPDSAPSKPVRVEVKLVEINSSAP